MQSTHLTWILALLPLVALADDEPAWLKEARAKEVKLLEATEIRSEDGAISARIPARLNGPISKSDGEYLITIALGDDTPVNCEVLLDGFDLATILRGAATETFKQVEAAQGKVEMSGVEGLDAGAFGPHPFLAARWLYRVAAKDGARVGGLKQVAVDHGGYGLYCAHVSLGYEQSFRTVVRALAETLTLKDAPPPPRYLEIATAKIGETPVGVAVIDVDTDKDGDTRTRSQMSMILPTGVGAIMAVESLQYQWTGADGALLNAGSIDASNGVTDSDLKLAPTDDGEWRVSGTFKGKPIDAVVGKSPPATMLGQARKRREVMAGKDAVGHESTDQEWMLIDPTHLVETRFKITGRRDDGRFTAQEGVGALNMDTVLDAATGLPTQATIPIGAQVIHVERIYVHGSP